MRRIFTGRAGRQPACGFQAVGLTQLPRFPTAGADIAESQHHAQAFLPVRTGAAKPSTSISRPSRESSRGVASNSTGSLRSSARGIGSKAASRRWPGCTRSKSRHFLHRLALRFGLGPSGETLRRVIQQAHATLRVDHHRRVGDRSENRSAATPPAPPASVPRRCFAMAISMLVCSDAGPSGLTI